MGEKRTFNELREIILQTLVDGKRTLNEISRLSGINWKTVDNHITYLIGRAMVTEVFNSPYVRIVELTEKGKEYLEHKK